LVHVITGAERHDHLIAFADHLDATRFALTVVTVGGDGELHAAVHERGMASVALGATGRWAYPRAAATLAAHLRKHRADVVHTHLLEGSLVGQAAAVLARTPTRVMTAHHTHEMQFYERTRPTVLADRTVVRRMARQLVAPCRQIAEQLPGQYGIDPRRIATIRHGLEPTRWQPDRVDGAQVRRELNLGAGPVIGTIGRSHWIKNHAALLEVFADVSKSLPQARLLIVGELGAEGASFRRRAVALGIDGQLVQTGPRSDVAACLAAMDIFVQPSLAEAYGLALVEAMAMRKVVVTTPVGVAAELISTAQNGFLASGVGSAALATALKTALDRRADWARIGGGARAAAEDLTAAAMVQRYMRLYDAITSSGAVSRHRRQ